MNAPARLDSFHGPAFFVALMALAIVGCSSSASSTPSTDNESTEVLASKCAGKACGADCSPPGSDEPFNCGATGRCVSAGHDLGCKACPEFLGDCIAGQIPADLDGDGCVDGCKAAAAAPECAGKACGVDCSPAGSDEPFNCNASGLCVVTGATLGCTAPPLSACASKACGVDCTPVGSDEPFNCNASGQCVGAGSALGCKR